MGRDYMKTPIGFFEIESDGEKLTGIRLMERGGRPLEAVPDELTDKAIEELEEYFSGARKSFDLPLALERGTDFQQKVWRVLMEIPYGKLASYSQVAKAAGCDSGARAAGNAVGANPFLIMVPCHRVIREDGTIGGFQAGTDNKRKLLAAEGVKL